MHLRGFVTKYNPSGKILTANPPLSPQVFKLGHTIDRRILFRVFWGCVFLLLQHQLKSTIALSLLYELELLGLYNIIV